MRRIYESSIKRNSGEQNNIHYAIYWICIDNMANPRSQCRREIIMMRNFMIVKMVILIITIQFNLLIWGNQFRTISDVNRI